MRQCRDTDGSVREIGEGDYPIVEPGVWLESINSISPRVTAARPGLFLDRDGVIVEETEYLCRASDVRLMPAAAGLIRRANRAHIPAVVVTNQAGINRGIYGWPQFLEVQREIADQLRRDGAVVDAVAACPFHPGYTPDFGKQHAHWRKPGPGMLLALQERLNIDLSQSWLVGDKAIDIEAARNAGLAGAVHVLTGHGPTHRTDALALADGSFSVIPADGLQDGSKALAAVMPELRALGE